MRNIYGCPECGNVWLLDTSNLDRTGVKFGVVLPAPRCPCGCMDDYSLCDGNHQSLIDDIFTALHEAEMATEYHEEPTEEGMR